MGKILNWDITRKDRTFDVRSKVIELLTHPLFSGDHLYLQLDKRGVKVGLRDSGEWAFVTWETLQETASEPLEGDIGKEWQGIIGALHSEDFVDFHQGQGRTAPDSREG